MNRTTGIMLVILGVVSLSGVTVAGIGISSSNNEVRLRNAITAKQKDNESQFDNMVKKISQVAQVTQKDRESLAAIFVEHAAARTTNSDAAVMKWVQESIPNVDSSTYRNLQNIIIGARNSWTMCQREILDLKREHDNSLDTFPSSLFTSGRSKIDVMIVTSTRAQESFKTGADDSTDVFGK